MSNLKPLLCVTFYDDQTFGRRDGQSECEKRSND